MLKGKHFLVTGASSGIGRAISEALIHESCLVTGIARDFSKWRDRRDGISQLTFDLVNLDDLPSFLKQHANLLENLSGVICCAGKGRFGSMEEFSATQIRELVDLNLTSQILLVRYVLPILKRYGKGDIVLMGSESALSGGARGAVYSATKFALRGFVQALRKECASNGVRVTIINPGMVKSPFFDELDFQPGNDMENYIEPRDVAEAVVSLLGMRPETVVDEINLSPLKKVIASKRRA